MKINEVIESESRMSQLQQVYDQFGITPRQQEYLLKEGVHTVSVHQKKKMTQTTTMRQPPAAL